MCVLNVCIIFQISEGEIFMRTPNAEQISNASSFSQTELNIKSRIQDLISDITSIKHRVEDAHAHYVSFSGRYS